MSFVGVFCGRCICERVIGLVDRWALWWMPAKLSEAQASRDKQNKGRHAAHAYLSGSMWLMLNYWGPACHIPVIHQLGLQLPYLDKMSKID